MSTRDRRTSASWGHPSVPRILNQVLMRPPASVILSDNPIAAARLPNGDTSLPNGIWAAAGATIATRTTVFVSYSTASPPSIGTVNTAIQNCPVGQVVEFGAGTFNLADTLVMKTGITVRGQGPNSTVLNFTNVGTASTDYFWGGGNIAICFSGSYGSPEEDVAPGMSNVPSRPGINWTGTAGNAGVYTQGATVLNLQSTPSGLAVGDTLVLWQIDEPNGNLPQDAWFFSAKTGASNAICNEGNSEHSGAAHQYRVGVTNINGTAVTVSPGIPHPTGAWKTALTPKAGWFQDTDEIRDAGLERLTVKTTAISGVLAGVGISWASNCWVVDCALDENASDGASEYGFYVTETHHITIKNCWIDSIQGGGGFGNTTSYGIAFKCTHNSRFENNIFANVQSPLMILICSTGNVCLYNYEQHVSFEGGLQAHQPGSCLNLCEGNFFIKFWADHFHGNTLMNTFVRNALADNGFNLHSYHRWYNFLGNVIDATVAYKSITTDSTKRDRFDSVAFRLGYPESGATAGPSEGVAADDNTWLTAFIWGNYATIGNSVRWDSAEVPSSDAFYPNPVPSAQTIPTSFCYSARPSYFTVSGVGTITWPPIGPEVTGGDGLNSRAYKLPAQHVYDAAGGAVASFNPSLYG